MADIPDEVREYFRRLGKKSAKGLTSEQRIARAKKAGEGRWDNSTPEERSAAASKAAQARWAKKGVKKAVKKAAKKTGAKKAG